MSLEQIKQNSIRITEKLEAELRNIPKNQSCMHTKYPNRMWCSERKVFAGYAICENCGKYNSRNLN